MKNTWVGPSLLAALLLVFDCSAHGQTPQQSRATDLAGTSWQLVKFQGSDDTTLTPDDKAKYTITFGTDGRVNARIDCNRGNGTWKSSGPNQLQFGPLALTRMMCPPGSLYDRIAKHWEFVRSYVIKDGHLFLSLMADGGIYEFEPMGGSKAATALADTAWQLVKFKGSDDTTLTPDDKAKYTIAFGSDGRVNTRIDCNRGNGTWKSPEPNQLQFGPLALTRVMCPPGSLHDRIAKHWEFVRSYVIKDGHLFLSLMADGGIYEFEPMGGSQPAASKSRVGSKGPVNYQCTQAGGGNDSLRATFYHTVPALVLVERGNQTRPAFQVPATSGLKYEAQDFMFWETRGEASVTWSGVELKCKPR